jgi:tetratricopeptide (TPR) repeat protein
MATIILILALLQSLENTYRSANEDFDAGRWADAAVKFELVLQVDPSHIPSRFNLAVCHTKTGNSERAIAEYQKILDQDAGIYEARTNLALLLDQSGKRAEAAGEYEKALELRPDDPRAHRNLGLFYMREQQIDKAYSHLLAAAGKDLNSAELYIALSEAEHARNDEAQSRMYLEKASQLDPSNKRVRRQLGIIYRGAGELSKAIDILRSLLPESRVELAVSYFENKNYAEALPLFEELTKAEPGNPDYLYFMGKSYAELKSYPRAVATLQQLLGIDPDYVEAYATLGSIFYGQGDWTRAAQMLTRVVELRPQQALGYFVLATCLDKLGNAKQAAVHYNKFLELDDGSNDTRSFQARQRAKTLERRLKK